MKTQPTIRNKAIYYVFCIISTLLYIGWLLLLSSCGETEDSPQAQISVFEGRVRRYPDGELLPRAWVVITRADSYEQLTQEVLNPVYDTVITDENGYYRLEVEALNSKEFYQLSAHKNGLIYKEPPLIPAKRIRSTNLDTLQMGVPAYLSLNISTSTHCDSLFLGVLPKQAIPDASNPLNYRLYPFERDTLFLHTYLYEDHQAIGITVSWQCKSIDGTPVSSFQLVELQENDTVEWEI